MTHIGDADLITRLRQEVDALELRGSGPDLRGVQRRGVRRRQARKVMAATAAAACLASGAIAIALLPGRGDDAAPAAPAPTASTDAEPAGQTFRHAIKDAGMTAPALAEPYVSLHPDTLQPQGWSMDWTIDTSPTVVVRIDVYPPGHDAKDELNPCLGQPSQMRSCSDEPIKGGARLLTGEAAVSGVTNSGRTAIWSPGAAVKYPDGRLVSARLDLVHQDFPRGDQPLTEDRIRKNPSPIGVDELAALVQDPGFTALHLEAHD